MAGTRDAVPLSGERSWAHPMCLDSGCVSKRWSLSPGHLLVELSSESSVCVLPALPCWAIGEAPGPSLAPWWPAAAPLHSRTFSDLPSPQCPHPEEVGVLFSLLHFKATSFPTHFPAGLTIGTWLSFRSNCQFHPPGWVSSSGPHRQS